MTEETNRADEAIQSAEDAQRAAQIATEATGRARDAVERAVRERPAREQRLESPLAEPGPDRADREAFRGADHLGEHGIDEGRL